MGICEVQEIQGNSSSMTLWTLLTKMSLLVLWDPLTSPSSTLGRITPHVGSTWDKHPFGLHVHLGWGGLASNSTRGCEHFKNHAKICIVVRPPLWTIPHCGWSGRRGGEGTTSYCCGPNLGILPSPIPTPEYGVYYIQVPLNNPLPSPLSHEFYYPFWIQFYIFITWSIAVLHYYYSRLFVDAPPNLPSLSLIIVCSRWIGFFLCVLSGPVPLFGYIFRCT